MENENKPRASMALQLLPLGSETRLELIDQVIRRLQASGLSCQVCPFETVVEGSLDQVLELLKACLELAGSSHENVFANVKINYGQILSTEEKLAPYSHD